MVSCLPRKVYDCFYQFKPHFRCAQARHFVLFCWLVVALILDQGKGKIKHLALIAPERIRYWALLRLLRSGQWDVQELIADFSGQLLKWLPEPCDGRLYLIGDTTLKSKRGQKHPLGRKARMNEYAAYSFGFEIVIVIASWGRYRLPVAVGVIDPQIRGHQNQLFRQMIQEFKPPAWAREVIVEADAGFAANETFRVIEQQHYKFVFAVARTRKFDDGKHVADFVRYLPKCHYHRVASYKPDARRKDYWVYSRQGHLNGLGEVTIVLSKRRHNDGPKKIKIIVTNLKGAKVGEILSIYARRWGIEVTIKELKGGLHLGQMQVTKEAERVKRSVGLSVMAYLLLVKLYGREESVKEGFSLFKLKQRFTAEVMQEQLNHLEQKWRRKGEKYKVAA